MKILYLLLFYFVYNQNINAQNLTWDDDTPVQLVVPYAPGGMADLLARKLQPHLEKSLGQRVIIISKPGAGGMLGSNFVAKQSNSEGKMVLLASINLSIGPHFDINSFDPVKNLTPLVGVTGLPSVLVTKGGNSPAIDSKEKLIKLLTKNNFSSLTYGSSGIFSGSHILGLQLINILNINGTHIPYKGGSAWHADLISNRLDFGFDMVPSVIQHINSNTMKPVAVTSNKRLKMASNIPTFLELGVSGMEFTTWFGFFIPSDVSVSTRDFLEKQFLVAINNEIIKQELANYDAVDIPQNRVNFTKWFMHQYNYWQKKSFLIKKLSSNNF